MIGIGTGTIIEKEALSEVSIILFGVAVIELGVGAFVGGDTLYGVAATGGGVAMIGLGVSTIAEGGRGQLIRIWWSRFTKVPEPDVHEHVESPDPTDGDHN